MSGFSNIQLALGAGPPVPAQAAILVVAQSTLGGTNDGAFRLSLDGGSSWSTPVTPTLGQAFVGAAFSLSRAETIALTGIGITVRSLDHGQTWSTLANNLTNLDWRDIIWVPAPISLYVAINRDAADTTKRLWTSPTGAVWTQRDLGVALNWEQLDYDPVTGHIWVVASTFGTTQPMLFSTDAINYTRNTAAAVAFQGNELAFSALSRLMVGNRSDTVTTQADAPLYGTWTNTGGIGGGQTFMCYDPAHDLFISGSTVPGIYSSPASGVTAWTSRASTVPFQGTEDMVWSTVYSKLIGVNPVQGANVNTRIIQSVNGTVFTQNVPGFLDTSSWGRIYEILY